MSEMPYRYTAELAGRIESEWQQRWEAEGTFQASNPVGAWADSDGDAEKEPMAVFDMFPYPSGAGLHVGHPFGYIATDVFSRFQRMNKRNVLHCMGYDAFGLPAEQYAVQTGQHPRLTTEANIQVMARQLKRLGLGLDERRSVRTMDPEFYRWTQWIFSQIFNAWYDTEAERPDGSLGRARPIADLEAELADGSRPMEGEFAGREWHQLSSAEQGRHLDGYRLAYINEAPVNWAPGLGTVLSNEEVTNDGRSERGNFPVFRRNLAQWMMRITAYADRLGSDLDRVDWPEKVKAMQRNWIGRSTGAKVTFTGPNGELIDVFTTRPDTLFGATFMVLAPEHGLVDSLVAGRDTWPEGTVASWTADFDSPWEAVAVYRRAASRKSDVERQMEDREKTGVFTGAFATNPVNGQPVPVFIADYVLMGYGTGAIMAVPAHDDRDFDFAQRFDLPILDVIAPADQPDWPGTVADGSAFTGDGVAVNSSNDEISLDGLAVTEAKATITQWLTVQGTGQSTVNYRLRDWLFSRQRYWGEPFPIVYDEEGRSHSLPDEMLPLELPDVADYSPKTFDPQDADSMPEPPLARVPDWVNVTLDLGDGPKQYRRETNTMPNWAGSCWYYLRYLDPANSEEFVAPENESYWIGPRPEPVPGAPAGTRDPGGVDLYVGGVEHAVLHLLYARFWHKLLFDLGHLSSEEPFRTYFSQGYIQAYAYRDAQGQAVPAGEVVTEGEGANATYSWQGRPVRREYGKMGKSLKNVVTPDDMYAEYGADTFRLYELGMGPLELSRPWDTRAAVGSQRFLQRLWRNLVDESTGEVTVVDEPLDIDTERIMHRSIDAVRNDYATLGFNTAVARLTEFNNALVKLDRVPRAAAEALVLMVAPLAPHIAEELWSKLGHGRTISYVDFPMADPELLVADTVTCAIQIKGKLRDTIEVPGDVTADDLERLALATPKVVAATGNGVRRVIVREPRLVNVVPA